MEKKKIKKCWMILLVVFLILIIITGILDFLFFKFTMQNVLIPQSAFSYAKYVNEHGSSAVQYDENGLPVTDPMQIIMNTIVGERAYSGNETDDDFMNLVEKPHCYDISLFVDENGNVEVFPSTVLVTDKDCPSISEAKESVLGSFEPEKAVNQEQGYTIAKIMGEYPKASIVIEGYAISGSDIYPYVIKVLNGDEVLYECSCRIDSELLSTNDVMKVNGAVIDHEDETAYLYNDDMITWYKSPMMINYRDDFISWVKENHGNLAEGSAKYFSSLDNIRTIGCASIPGGMIYNMQLINIFPLAFYAFLVFISIFTAILVIIGVTYTIYYASKQNKTNKQNEQNQQNQKPDNMQDEAGEK